ncbi:MAG: hypothetical protein Q9157_002317 [Trypethelium eluteriae]
MNSHNNIDKCQHPTWNGKEDHPDPLATQQKLNNGSQNAPRQGVKLDMYKLNVLADLASTLPYLPAPEKTGSETETESELGTSEDLPERPTAWEILLKAADEEYKKDCRVHRIQLKLETEDSHMSGRLKKWHKPWTTAENAALLTLKAEGLSFKDMERLLPGRFSSAIQQRWYRIRHKIERHTRRGDGPSDQMDHGSSEDGEVRKLRRSKRKKFVA